MDLELNSQVLIFKKILESSRSPLHIFGFAGQCRLIIKQSTFIRNLKGDRVNRIDYVTARISCGASRAALDS